MLKKIFFVCLQNVKLSYIKDWNKQTIFFLTFSAFRHDIDVDRGDISAAILVKSLKGSYDDDNYYDTFSAESFSNEKDEEWTFFRAKDVLVYIERISKTKIFVTTKNGEIVLENFEYEKAKLLIAVISSSGLEISNIQYDYNVWIAYIILPLTLTCTLGYVKMLTFSTI